MIGLKNDFQLSDEPSGVKLMRLIDSQITEIIRKEHGNVKYIYLYGAGGFWTAFEQSAYLLCNVFSITDVSVITNTAYPFPILMASISDSALQTYAKQHIFKCDKMDYKELLATNLHIDDYQRWRKVEITAYTEALSTDIL